MTLSQKGEARLQGAHNLHLFIEHGVGSHPQARVSIQRPVDNKRFLGFAVPCNTNNFILAAFVVLIAPQRRLGQWF